MRSYRTLALFFLLLTLVFNACSGEPDPQETVTAPPPAASDATTAAPETPSEPAENEATPTPAPLVSTPQGESEETSAATPTAGTEPTQSIPGLIGPDNFPPEVNPLTGLQVDDPARLQRRPIAIKVSNYPAAVRPQAGLNDADLVFEHYAEGGVTRFTAVFYGNDANQVGSIRSGRLIDLEIPRMYDAAFAYSGASGPVRLMMRDSPFFDRIISPDFGHGGFYRVEDPDKAVEHTLFTDTSTLRAILQERGQDTPPQFQTNMAFHADAPAGGAPASSLEVRYVGTNVFWLYDPITMGYMRSTDGAAHVDANTGQQLNFKNIIVLAAHHEDTGILEDMVGGGHYSTQIQIWGEGPVSIFRDGQRFDGRWRRENPDDMLTFYDLEGNILPLAPGKSFFQMAPLGFDGLVVNE
ncbi:MAG: DUF3048 domain-containing protein [Chloroflexota bacterium]